MRNLILIVVSLFIFACSSEKGNEQSEYHHFVVDIKGK